MSLPKRARLAFSSDLSIQLHDELCQKYELKGGAREAVTQIVSDLIYGKVSLEQLPARMSQSLKLPPQQLDQLVYDIIGTRLLPFDEEYGNRPSQYLVGHQVDIHLYDQYLQRYNQTIAEEQALLDSLKQPVTEVSHSTDPVVFERHKPEEERKDVIDIFGNSIVDLILSDSHDVIQALEDYNGILLELFEQYKDLPSQIEQALYRNAELLTSKQLVVNDKQVPPSVGNWLRAFIARTGPNYFDNVVLSQFLISDSNCRQLSGEERDLVSQLLTMYRTIKFFPMSLSNIPPEQWQIIPIIERPGAVPETDPQPFPDDDVPTGVSPSPGLATELRQYDWKSLTGIERRALLEQYSITEDDLSRLGIT